MRKEGTIQQSLLDHDLVLSERLGQHFLVDDKIIKTLKSCVIPGAKVIEVGSGIGHVTEAIAEKAGGIIGIEIDSKFQSLLEEVSGRKPKIRFVISDVLRMDLRSLAKQDEVTQVIANLPFHITEPFLSKLVDLSIESAVLLLGDSAAQEIAESEDSPHYGRLSLIVETFFNARQLSRVPKTSFYPQPRTDAILVELTPKKREEIQANPANFVFAYLIRRVNKYGLVINEIKQALVDASRLSSKGSFSKKEANRRDRSETKRQLRYMVLHNGGLEKDNFSKENRGRIISQADALEKIARMGISSSILQKPFFALNNQEIQELVRLVKKTLE